MASPDSTAGVGEPETLGGVPLLTIGSPGAKSTTVPGVVASFLDQQQRHLIARNQVLESQIRRLRICQTRLHAIVSVRLPVVLAACLAPAVTTYAGMRYADSKELASLAMLVGLAFQFIAVWIPRAIAHSDDSDTES